MLMKSKNFTGEKMETSKIREIDIQAPGKNYEFARQAFLCGADSVYIGAPKFSMRYEYVNALDDLKKTIEFAHKYWAKVYVPVNTLLYSDNDLKEMQKLIHELWEMGADAIIIQDLGILELNLPPIPIFLSTNTACFTKEVIDFYKQIGINRIILPRELTINQIKEITSYTDIDLEAFCYGFLCVGYSGKCYLTYTENLSKGMSVEESHYKDSNCGVCPERCMGFWNLYDADGNLIAENDRLLNLKFLNLADKIEELTAIGVCSFKITGRECDLKYVKNSVANFSIKANEIVQNLLNTKRLSSGRVIYDYKPDFSKNFNKGYTDLFYNGRKQELYSKSLLVGDFAGKVTEQNANSFKINGSLKLAKGDKLRFKDDNENIVSFTITDVSDDNFIFDKPECKIKGKELYRYINAIGFKEVEDAINYRIISVALKILEIDKNTYSVTVTDEDKNTISVLVNKGEYKIKKESFETAFYRLSQDCEFLVENIDFQDDLYIENVDKFLDYIFEKLRAERINNRPTVECTILKNNYPYPYKKLSDIANVTNKKAYEFFKRHGVEEIEEALENTENIEGKRVFNSKYCLKYELGFCSKTNPKNKPKEPWIIENLENLNRFKIECDCKNCEMHFYYQKPV